MTAALLDRLTHQCDILELTGESYRFRESMKAKHSEADKTPKESKTTKDKTKPFSPRFRGRGLAAEGGP